MRLPFEKMAHSHSFFFCFSDAVAIRWQQLNNGWQRNGKFKVQQLLHEYKDNVYTRYAPILMVM